MLGLHKPSFICCDAPGGVGVGATFVDSSSAAPDVVVIIAAPCPGKDHCNPLVLLPCLNDCRSILGSPSKVSVRIHIYYLQWFVHSASSASVCRCGTKSVARALVEQVFCRYGTPLALLSDRGGEMDGSVMRELCRLLRIDKLRTSAYHPACNAACERMHRTLNTLLGKVVRERQNDWCEHLPFVAAALRASPREATGYSANFLMFGREVNTPADIV